MNVRLRRFKNKIRLVFVPVLANWLFSFGWNWKDIGKTLGRESLISQLGYLKKQNKTKKITNKSKLDIYILTITCGNTYNLCLEILLGIGLKLRGHRVKFILDDLQLPITTDMKSGKEKYWKSTVLKGFNFGKTILKKGGFKIIYVSDLVNENEINKRKNIFPEIVDASLLKHYKIGVITEDTPDIEERTKLFTEAIAITAKLGKEIVNLKPDRVIMSTGIYSTWGPPRIILNKANIPVLTYSKTKKKDTEKFNWKYASDWWDVSDEWNKVKDIPLTKAENQKLDEYLESRITHEKDVLKYNFGLFEDRKLTFERFNFSPDKPVYSLFTNVLWDAASAQREIAFDNPVEWVYKTIEWFMSHTDYQLIVKIHPAEVVIGTNQPFYSLILKKFPSLPKNIRIIQPNEKINSWSIVNITTLGLVHTTTVGMELPLKGVPCIVASKTHFRGKGFTIDIENSEDYFRLLENFNIKDYNLHEMEKYSRRYAYLLFERYQIPMPFFFEPFWTDVRAFSFNSFGELMKNKHFNFVLDNIEKKGQFILPQELI